MTMLADMETARLWDQVSDLAYLAASVLFIFALKAMGSPKHARRGNMLGAMGMLIAIVVTVIATDKLEPLRVAMGFTNPHTTYVFIIIGLIVGSLIGAYLAMTVRMTAMPQMVAAFNGFGGLASALVVLAGVYALTSTGPDDRKFVISSAASTLVGWVTFTGSMVAYAKLQEVVISGRPLTFPFQKLANFAALFLALALMAAWGYWPEQRWIIIPLGLLSMALGVMFVIPVGGADMPVMIALLNSYSGFAAAATGFVLDNSGLIVAGALVGSSGIILTSLMCKAMNRSLANVLFGAVGSVIAGPASAETRHVRSWTAQDAAMTLEAASLVIIVPGYGMAVAQAQHAVKELATVLGKRGANVKFGIHPVAGRMPGHMNVLLAEAEVPYEQLCDIDQINPEFPRADVALIIGANDVVNPAARHDKSSPLFGMPILDVDKAGTVMICKRSLNPGFAGVENELFYADNASMLFGDAKAMVSDIVAALKQ